MFFDKSDLEMTALDIYQLEGKDRKIAELPCVEISDDTVEVGSQQNIMQRYKVLHDGTKPIMCECTWSSYHPKEYITPEGTKIMGNECKSHFKRVQWAIDKRTARLAAEKQSKVAISVEVKASVEVKPAERKREHSPLHVKPFSLT
jgi:hypothetical protein